MDPDTGFVKWAKNCLIHKANQNESSKVYVCVDAWAKPNSDFHASTKLPT